MNDSFCPPTVCGFCTVGGLSSAFPSPPQPASSKAAAATAVRHARGSERATLNLMACGTPS